MHTISPVLDCLIIGAGPAGISAALYLLRFQRTIGLVDCGESRTLLIPKSHNYPGFVKGISGPKLLQRLKAQLAVYKNPIINEEITEIKVLSSGFLANQHLHSKTIILATGVEDIEPQLPEIEQAIRMGLVRHCPVCDAYEVKNKRIAVLGNSTKGLKEALFLRRYSPYITLLTQKKEKSFSQKEMRQIEEACIEVIEEPILKLEKNTRRIVAFHFGKTRRAFDTIYSALGCHKRNKLALDLGISHKEGDLIVDECQQTSLPGFYAAGDVVSGLNQICVAQSQGAIAATAINKLLSGGS